MLYKRRCKTAKIKKYKHEHYALAYTFISGYWEQIKCLSWHISSWLYFLIFAVLQQRLYNIKWIACIF